MKKQYDLAVEVVGSKRTYSVDYYCCNCGCVFTSKILFGQRASRSEVCPNCGTNDTHKDMGD